jgi:molybdenum cofactor cytidylyltransferase
MIPAIVPAAGRSARMGQPKLVLPIEGQPLIGKVVHALREGGAGPIVVVAPAEMIAGAQDVADAAERAGAQVIIPRFPPPEMRCSVELGLDWLEQHGAPEAFLLAPGDSAGISAELVRLVLAALQAQPGSIIVPTHAGKRGHPVLFPWTMTATIRALPEHVGINTLMTGHAPVHLFETPHAGALQDIDTPEDYRTWTP